MGGKVLVLGASGRFGRHAAEAFWNRDWTVTLFDRATDDLMRAAEGQDVIVNAWNPPYDRWAAELPGLTDRVIAAAKASGATVLVPGNVYVYGTGSGPVLGVDTPHRATNTLGRLRIEMETAYRRSGVPTIVLRAGDFLDTAASGNWFDRIMMSRAHRGVFLYPGDPDLPHAWAYLPDLSETAARLAERRADLPCFADLPCPGLTLTGREMAALVSQALGREVRLRGMSWLPLRIAAPVWKMARHLIEMRYLWSMPHALDAGALDELLGDLPATPASEAVASAVRAAMRLEVDPDQPVPERRALVA